MDGFGARVSALPYIQLMATKRRRRSIKLLICPVCEEKGTLRKILYGMPDPETFDFEKYAVGRCCFACGWWVEHTVLACPNCKASNFDHRDPEMQIDPWVGSTPVLQRKSQYEIEDEERLQREASMDPDLLARFKHRFQLKLEEIAYLEWRAMQPEWKFQVMKAEKDPKSQAIVGGFVGPHAVTTAAGVFIGTTIIGTELDEMNDDEGGKGSDGSGDDEGEIAGFLDGLFD